MSSDPRATQRLGWIALLSAAACCSILGQSAGSASIYGEVLDEANIPVRGAKVVISRVSGPRLTVPFDSQVIVTDTLGMFSFTGLPGGLFRLCPNLSGSDYIDSCQWLDNPPSVSILNGQTRPGVRLFLVRGKLLDVRIDDDEGKLKKNAQGVQPQDLVFVKVLSGKRTIEVRASARDKNGQNHLIAVPIGRSLKLDVSSPGLDVRGKGGADAVNVQAAPGGMNATETGQSFEIKGNESSKQFRFSVKGKAK